MQTKLTAAFVRKVTEIEPPTRDSSYFDTVLPRFALRVKPPKTPDGPWWSLFFVRYTPAGSKAEVRIKVGNPRTMPLEQGRAVGKATLAKVDAGGNPGAELAAKRAAWTVTEAWDQYVHSPEFAKKPQRGKVDSLAVARLHVLHHLGAVKIADIDVPAVKRMHRAVEADSRVNRRKRKLGGPGSARKVVRQLSSLLSWCVGEGRLARNPIIGALRLDGDGERTTVLDRPEQYSKLFGTMDLMVTEKRLRPKVRAFVTVLAATGMRRGEAQTLVWGDIDLGARRITLRNPKGAKLARGGASTETVSLPPIAAAALASIRPHDATDNDQVFVHERGKVMAVNHDWARIRKEAEMPTDLVLHSLRHSIGTAGIVAGMSTAEVGKMLRHRNIAVTAKYVHLAEAGRSRFQDRAMEGLLPTTVDAWPSTKLGERA